MALHSTPIRVVLADDHEMVRQALARILEESGRVTIVAQTGDGPEVVSLTRSTLPDVVVLDYTLPNHDAPQVIGMLLDAVPQVRVLVLTVHENIHYAVRVLETGAQGYLIKSAAVDELVDAIEKVHKGGIYLSNKISDDVLQHMRRPKRERVGLESLSQREFDFLRLFGSGMGLQKTAKQMNITTSTASTYRSRIMEKLNLASTADLIRYAIQQDVVK
jgi:two-component system invasion response regulator UvrY